MSDTPVPSSDEDGLRHMFFPYAGAQPYLSGLLTYIEQARDAGATVVVCAPDDHRKLLSGQVPDDGSVAFVDPGVLRGNPGRLIPSWQEWIGERGREGAVYGVSECAWSGRSAARRSELRYHEWLLNVAFAHAPAWSLLCPYDTSGQADTLVEALSRSHPLVWNGESGITTPHFDQLAPYEFEPFAEPPGRFEQLAYTIDELTVLRERVTEWAVLRGLPADRTRDLLLSVTEVASNSIRHGGGRGTLRIWVEDGDLVCEFRDRGLITDPLVGRVRPAVEKIGGCGLWFVHQLCDLVEIRSDEREGTRIRVHMELPSGVRHSGRKETGRHNGGERNGGQRNGGAATGGAPR